METLNSSIDSSQIKLQTIGEIVASDHLTAKVFEKFGLDFCCGGKKTIDAACMEKGIDTNEVHTALKEISNQETRHINMTLRLSTLILCSSFLLILNETAAGLKVFLGFVR